MGLSSQCAWIVVSSSQLECDCSERRSGTLHNAACGVLHQKLALLGTTLRVGALGAKFNIKHQTVRGRRASVGVLGKKGLVPALEHVDLGERQLGVPGRYQRVFVQAASRVSIERGKSQQRNVSAYTNNSD
jgi:hypothetical protein